jgi:hypothetical protein
MTMKSGIISTSTCEFFLRRRKNDEAQSSDDEMREDEDEEPEDEGDEEGDETEGSDDEQTRKISKREEIALGLHSPQNSS